MNTRTFLKLSGLASLATFVAPAMFAIGIKDWPEYENGLQLRKIYKIVGKKRLGGMLDESNFRLDEGSFPNSKWPCKTVRVRMKNLKEGDLFYTDDNLIEQPTQKLCLHSAQSDPWFDDKTGTWTIMTNTV